MKGTRKKGVKPDKDFLLRQYAETRELEINHNYLPEQFADSRAILADIGSLVREADYTLGRSVLEFEENIRKLLGCRRVVSVGSGTDALILSLMAAGVGEGDEVITTPYSFIATAGAIVTAGARPVFVDIREDYDIDPSLIERAVTKRTKAVLPVHWAGLPCDMAPILALAEKRGLAVIEDSCHAILAERGGRKAGTFGLAGCFSMHPLKNLNVWGDGGFIATDSDALHDRAALLRNHGLVSRDECAVFSFNSRLDSIQAIVANHLLKKLGALTEARIAHAARLDSLLADIPQITVPPRPEGVKQVYHLYVIRAERRDALREHLIRGGVDAKIHYPVPLHLQPAARGYGYRRGDLPVAEAVCGSILSLPVHEFITDEQLERMAALIREFYE